MSDPISQILEQTWMGARALLEFGSHLINPTIRLGVTGMSGAGKTVFITALIHGLVRGGRFPVFEALANGRVSEDRLSPPPGHAPGRFHLQKNLGPPVPP